MGGARVSEADKRRLFELVREGSPLNMAARAVGIKRGSAQYICARAGVRTQHGPGKVPLYRRPEAVAAIPEARAQQVEADLERCLLAGAWGVASELIRRARGTDRLVAAFVELRAVADGPTLATTEPKNGVQSECHTEAALLARAIGVHLRRGDLLAAQAVLASRRETLTTQDKAVK